MKKKKVTLKNYAYLLLIAISVVVLTLYINSWYKTYKVKKLQTSPLDGIVQKISIKELNVSVSEMNDVLLYIGFLNNEKIYKMEERMLDFIKKEDVVSKVVYVDASSYMKNDNYKNVIKDVFKDTEFDPELPMMLYVKNGKVLEIIKPEYGLIQTYQIKNVIDKYELNN